MSDAEQPLRITRELAEIDRADVPAMLAYLVQRVDALNGEVKRLRLRLADSDLYDRETEDQDALKVGDLSCGRCGIPAEYVLCEHCTRMTAARLEAEREKVGP